MLLRSLDLTTALRPSLAPDETLLFVQDAVGLYQGKLKLPDYQNGQVYLTSHRACYVDNDDPRNRAVAVNLKDVDRSELYARFLKSSPKITLYPKAAKHVSVPVKSPWPGAVEAGRSASPREGSPRPQKSTPPPSQANNNATWICPICSFSNPVPANFDPTLATEDTPLPPCLTCGIKPPFVLVVKAAIAGLSSRQPVANGRDGVANRSKQGLTGDSWSPSVPGDAMLYSTCPRCTFQNHPSLKLCELCSAPLASNSYVQATPPASSGVSRTESPGPSLAPGAQDGDPTESIKFSFRGGGEKIFHERLKGALVQRKWLLKGAPPAPKHDTTINARDGASPKPPPPPKAVGISGLEKRDLELRKNNEVVIGNAFEDLSALMASAKEIIALAETFAKQTKSSTLSTSDEPGAADPAALLSQLNLTTTKDMLGPSSSSSANASLYLTQLSRQLAEFLTDDSSGVGVLKSAGGIISLVDLWAIFNRARGGVELVSPTDFADAAQLFEKLKLPVRLRRFRSGLLVVQGADRTDEKTVKALLDWLRDLRSVPPETEAETPWDWRVWGRGLTALEVAERFGWSVGVATEELEMAEERGALCREVAVEGVRFWENWLVVGEEELVGMKNQVALAAN